MVYLPVVQGPPPLSHQPFGGTPRVHLPYFDGDVPYAETAVFWFGAITPSHNYADLRMGYNPNELYINLSIADRRLWYDTTPSANDLTSWDAVSLFLQVDPDKDGPIYRFDAQLSFWEPRADYQAAYRLQGNQWVAHNFPLSAKTAWRGDGPNTSSDDRGWVVTFQLPFSGFNLSSPPHGKTWRLAAQVHDRDGQNEAPQPVVSWPQGVNLSQPGNWSRLGFGTPGYTTPQVSSTKTVTLRHRLDGAVVTDGEVGGGTICGDGLDFWTEWGAAVYPGFEDNSNINIQNQADIADWPCFARYYLTFPLNRVPPGMKIVSARVILHQYGGPGDPQYDNQPQPSYIQVFRIAHDWQENNLSWNNSPQAYENVSGAWVDPAPAQNNFPGIPWQWDVSRAVAESYAEGSPLRLAFYSADSAYHSGKYFISSDTGDWNYRARPMLEIVYGPAR